MPQAACVAVPARFGVGDSRRIGGWSRQIAQRKQAWPDKRMLDEDAELLARIRNGAVDDFAEIVQRHQSQVFAILCRYERDRHKLEDLAQETFVKAWRALASFDGRAPFQHWLSRIATRVALDHLRKERRRRNEVGLGELGDDALEWLRQPDEHDELDAAQAAEILAMAMRQLTPREQLVLTMLELEGRSVKEIAAYTRSSGVAVRVRAMRARGKLRRILDRLAETRR
jgi:RNA polymerase sigma-70 factor (ECF subfamily)